MLLLEEKGIPKPLLLLLLESKEETEGGLFRRGDMPGGQKRDWRELAGVGELSLGGDIGGVTGRAGDGAGAGGAKKLESTEACGGSAVDVVAVAGGPNMLASPVNTGGGGADDDDDDADGGGPNMLSSMEGFMGGVGFAPIAFSREERSGSLFSVTSSVARGSRLVIPVQPCRFNASSDGH